MGDGRGERGDGRGGGRWERGERGEMGEGGWERGDGRGGRWEIYLEKGRKFSVSYRIQVTVL